jgi:hypothetical protein
MSILFLIIMMMMALLITMMMLLMIIPTMWMSTFHKSDRPVDEFGADIWGAGVSAANGGGKCKMSYDVEERAKNEASLAMTVGGGSYGGGYVSLFFYQGDDYPEDYLGTCYIGLGGFALHGGTGGTGYFYLP